MKGVLVDEEQCIRCNTVPAVDESGYCGYCLWAVRADAECGLHQLGKYLHDWARFSEWCNAHGQTAV
jgi:hypothetical protein